MWNKNPDRKKKCSGFTWWNGLITIKKANQEAKNKEVQIFSYVFLYKYSIYILFWRLQGHPLNLKSLMQPEKIWW